MEDDLKILKVEYLSSHLLDLNQILNLEENSEEISSVALLSPACSKYFTILAVLVYSSFAVLKCLSKLKFCITLQPCYANCI